MEWTGEIKGIVRDYQTNQYNITFTVNESSVVENEYDKLKDCKLSIRAVKYRKKRSLDANAYFHVLVGKIAEARTVSKARAKNELITKYGQPELLEDGNALIYKTNAPVEYMLELETIHSIPIKFTEENGKEVVFYKLYRGSHTYNSKEMSDLIEGTVADAKELDIETLTPLELERMKAQWNQ